MNWDKKNFLAIVVAILIVAGIGNLCKIICSTEENLSIAPITEIKETKTPFTYLIKRMKVTAYCPCKKCCGKFADGKTSIGKNAWKTLGVAADPAVLPYGTKLEIPGIGIRTVDDTGGAMRQSTKKGICHIDIRFHNHEAAKKFGAQRLNVRILSPVN